MWSRAFPGMVLVVAAATTVVIFGEGFPSEIRLAAAGVSCILLAAAAAMFRRRRDPPPVVTVPAPPILPPSGPTPAAELARRPVNYEIISKLASGGMGEIFLAWQHGPRSFRRHVVLKRLHARLCNDMRVVDMFLNEAQLAAGLSHPNIVPIHELYQDEDDGSYVLVMEYVQGPTLLGVLRERSRRRAGLPYGPLVRIAGAVCDALHHAYASPGPDGDPRRIIHRDVSPSNVMIRYDGEVKLLDFGLAKVTAAGGSVETTITGKLGYMSPEQLCGEPLDHQTDVFSLGIILWEMAVGRRLFRRENDSQMIHAILRTPIPKPSSVTPALHSALDDIVMRALARDRSQRYADAATLARDLRALSDEQGWPRRRQDLVALAREAERAVPRWAGDDISTGTMEHTDVIDADADASNSIEIEFDLERSAKTIEIALGQDERARTEVQTPSPV